MIYLFFIFFIYFLFVFLFCFCFLLFSFFLFIFVSSSSSLSFFFILLDSYCAVQRVTCSCAIQGVTCSARAPHNSKVNDLQWRISESASDLLWHFATMGNGFGARAGISSYKDWSSALRKRGGPPEQLQIGGYDEQTQPSEQSRQIPDHQSLFLWMEHDVVTQDQNSAESNLIRQVEIQHHVVNDQPRQDNVMALNPQTGYEPKSDRSIRDPGGRKGCEHPQPTVFTSTTKWNLQWNELLYMSRVAWAWGVILQQNNFLQQVINFWTPRFHHSNRSRDP